MAISQNFPTTRPSLNLNFARSRKLDSRVTFTRGSTGTYVDESGLIRTAGINEARFDYDPISGESLGLLIEESRSNLLTYSEDFTNAVWTLFGTASRTANTVTAPDGNTTADTIVVPNSSGIYQFFSTSAGITYTFSVWLRTPSSPQNILIVLNTNLGDPIETTITVTSTWQRFSVTKTTAVGTTLISSQLSQGSGGTFYAWGAQTEVGSFPTSYIPTAGSTVTRSADIASITGTNFTDFYNQYPFSVFSSYKIPYVSTTAYPRIWEISNSSVDNRINHYLTPYPAPTYASAGIVQSGSVVASQGSAATLNQNVKTASRFAINNFTHTVNGVNQGTDTSCDFSATTRDRMFIGCSINSADILNSTISQISYYPVALTNDQLASLTK